MSRYDTRPRTLGRRAPRFATAPFCATRDLATPFPTTESVHTRKHKRLGVRLGRAGFASRGKRPWSFVHPTEFLAIGGGHQPMVSINRLALPDRLHERPIDPITRLAFVPWPFPMVRRYSNADQQLRWWYQQRQQLPEAGKVSSSANRSSKWILCCHAAVSKVSVAHSKSRIS